MKDKKNIYITISLHRARHKVRKRKFKRLKRRNKHLNYIKLKNRICQNGKITYENICKFALSSNIKYLLDTPNSPFCCETFSQNELSFDGVYYLPKNFSLISNANDSFAIIHAIFFALINQAHKRVIIDYTRCCHISLEAQVFLDVILKDIIRFFKFCENFDKYRPNVQKIQSRAGGNVEIENLLYSVGSPAVHCNDFRRYNDVIPYRLCEHKMATNLLKQMDQKDIDTTSLVEYVVECMHKMGRNLTAEQKDHLCTVVGETLINDEEHSTTHCRYTIGYFKEREEEGTKYGDLQLVILNIGNSIYEKFKDPLCPNKSIVDKMKKLSDHYSAKNYFFNKFDEAALWTLYALQDGVTSVSTEEYKKRGNGSLQFVESFLSLKAENQARQSKMHILSGDSMISFDGKYKPTIKTDDNSQYKVITFNSKGDLHAKPDSKYVRQFSRYFPGTIIYANIIL
jgi:hypothetical protein